MDIIISGKPTIAFIIIKSINIDLISLNNKILKQNKEFQYNYIIINCESYNDMLKAIDIQNKLIYIIILEYYYLIQLLYYHPQMIIHFILLYFIIHLE